MIKVIKRIIPEFVSAAVIYIMMFFSAIPQLGSFLEQDIFWIFINWLIVLAVIQLFCFLTGKLWISLLVTSVGSFIWSIADYYTVLYHGAPLFFSEYANARTAFDVMGSYSFAIDSDVIKEIAGFVVLLGITFLTFLMEKKKGKEKDKSPFLKRGMSLVFALVGMGIALFVTMGPLEIKPENVMGWSWNYGVKNYGILVCSIEDADNLLSNPYKIPEEYSAEALDGICAEKTSSDEVYPNIIVILNETFFDLEKVYDVEPDVNVLEDFYNIENAQYGYAYVGGGTNNAEYALLTSNSVYLLNVTVPFNYVDFNESTENIVTYIEKLGYSTTGMHCGEKENYRRNIAYPLLGFDNIYLGKDSFKYHNRYYKREWLDSDNYKDMLERFDEDDSSRKFMFLLTYQNHGGYNQNDASCDTVHVKNGYDETTTGYLNEYLTSLKMSADAFVELTETLKDAPPAVVVMVGDHEPSFAGSFPLKASAIELDRSMVPYVIWTNYKEVPSKYSGPASMEDLMPMIAELADLPLSAYYEKILSVHESVPVRSGSGELIDKNGILSEYSKESEYYKLLNEYYCMEYNALVGGDDYKDALFTP